MKNKKKKKDELFGIIGLGRFGTALAQTLSAAGKEVIVIDRDQEKIDQAVSMTDNAFRLDNLSQENLEKVGISDCDVVAVCIGEDISVSIMATLTVIRMGVPRVISKARNEDHGKVLEVLGAEVIYPEHDMGTRLANRLISPSFFEYLSLSGGIEIMEIRIPDHVAGITIAELDVRKRFGLNVIAVNHDGEVSLEIGPKTFLDRGDFITVVGKQENVFRFERSLQ